MDRIYLRERENKTMSSDRKDLKIQALLEKVSSLTTNYENQIADLRVELTLSEENLQELQAQQQAQNVHNVTDVQPQIVGGEVVQEATTTVSS